MRRSRASRPAPRSLPSVLERLEDRRLLAGFSTGGSTLSIDLTTAGTLAVTTSGSGNYVFSLEGGDTFSGTDATGLTGNGLATLTVTSALDLSQVSITNSAGTTAVRFADSSGSYADSFTVKLSGIAGLSGWVPSVKFVGKSAFADAASLTVTAPAIAVEAGDVSTAAGALTLTGDTGSSFAGNYSGVTITKASSVSTVGGALTIVGRGGTGETGNQNGVDVGPGSRVQAGDAESAAVPLKITGVGGASGGTGGNNNHGIVLESGSDVSAFGPLALAGTGGPNKGANRGVVVSGRVSVSAPATGTPPSLDITGTGGGQSGTADNHGVLIGNQATVSGEGPIVVTGTAGPSTTLATSPYTTSSGIYLNSAHVNSPDGPITFKADSFRLQGTAGAIGTGGTVAFENTVDGQTMLLDKPVNAVLARTYAQTIRYGTTNAVIEQDAAAGGGDLVIGIPALVVAGSKIRLRANVTSGGAQTWNGPVVLGEPTAKSAAAGDVRLAGGGITLAGTVDGAKNLTLSSKSSPIAISGAVGKTTPLASLSIESASTVKADSTLAIDGSAAGAAKNGLTFAPGVNSIDMQVPGSTVLNAAQDGIVLGQTTGSTLSGFTVKNSGVAGIRASGDMTATKIVGNRVEGGGKSAFGAYLADTPGLSFGVLGTGTGNVINGASTGVEATGNMDLAGIRGNTIDANTRGLRLNGARGAVVASNTLTSNSSYGILAEGDDTGTALRNNSVTGSSLGIVLEGAKGLRVGMAGAGNVVQAGLASATGKYDATRTSIGLKASGDLTGTTVVANSITDNTVGISLADARGLAVRDGNLLFRNRFQGIAVSGTSTSTTIRGTTIEGSLPGGVRAPFGIWLSSATGLVVGGDGDRDANGVYCVTNAVWAGGAMTGSAIKRTIVRNVANGIVLNGARGFWVQSNDVLGATQQGLNASGDCTGTTVLFNRLVSGQHGAVIDAARSLAVKNNVIESNTVVGLFATGNCTGTKVSDNAIVRNTVNLSTSSASGGWFQPS